MNRRFQYIAVFFLSALLCMVSAIAQQTEVPPTEVAAPAAKGEIAHSVTGEDSKTDADEAEKNTNAKADTGVEKNADGVEKNANAKTDAEAEKSADVKAGTKAKKSTSAKTNAGTEKSTDAQAGTGTEKTASVQTDTTAKKALPTSVPAQTAPATRLATQSATQLQTQPVTQSGLQIQAQPATQSAPQIHPWSAPQSENGAVTGDAGKSPEKPSVFQRVIQSSNRTLSPETENSWTFQPQPPQANEALPLYLTRKNGRLVAIPGVKLEQVEEILRTFSTTPETKNATPAPDFVIHSLMGDATMEDNVLRVQVTLQIETFRDSPVRVPLRFDEGILLGEPLNASAMEFSDSGSLTRTIDEVAEAKEEEQEKEEKGEKEEAKSQGREETPAQTPSTPNGNEAPSAEAVAEKDDANAETTGTATNGNETPSTEAAMADGNVKSSAEAVANGNETPTANAATTGNAVPAEATQAAETPNAKLTNRITRMRQSAQAARKYTGNGRIWIEFLENNGFAAWVLGKGVHQLELTFLVPITTSGTEKRLELQLPYATTSELRLQIPQTAQDFAATSFSLKGGTMLQPAHFERSPSSTGTSTVGNTHLSAMRLGGEFSLAWNQQTKAQNTDTPLVLDAEGLIFVVLGKEMVRYDARLKIFSSDAEIDTFRVRLPENAELLPLASADYTLTLVPSQNDENRPIVEVKMKRKRSGILRVDLPVRVPLSEKKTSEWFDISGFEVLSAARQSGYYAIRTLTDQHANWAINEDLQRYDDLPFSLESWRSVRTQESPLVPASLFESSSAPANPNATPSNESDSEIQTGISLKNTVVWDAVFEFASQPAPLWTRIVTRTTHVNIEPKYRVTISQNEAQLEAIWDCTIRGGKIAWLDFDLGDWTLDSVGPANLVENDTMETGVSRHASVPFVQPVTGHLSLVFRASRKITETENELRLTLPKRSEAPQPNIVTTMTPADVAIVSATNIELIPDDEASEHLVRQPVTAANEWLASDAPHALLYRSESEDATFVTHRKIHQRTIAVREHSQLEIQAQEYHVVQSFEYTVAYGGVSQLQFRIPDQNAERLDVRFFPSNAAGTPGAVGTPNAMGPPNAKGTSSAAGMPNTMGPLPPSGNGPRLFRDSDSPSPRDTDGSNRPSGRNRTEAQGTVETGTPPLKESDRMATMPLETKVRTSSDPLSRLMTLDVLLPGEHIGTFTVELRYSLPMERTEREGHSAVDFRLALPMEVQLVENLLEIHVDAPIQILPLRTFPENLPWTELGETGVYHPLLSDQIGQTKKHSTATNLVCRATTPQDHITLGLEVKAAITTDIKTIDRFWLQTWLTGSMRQDRAVFLFPPMADSMELNSQGIQSDMLKRTFTLHLPQGASADEAEVWIDRQAAKFGSELKRLSANTLQVVLPAVAANVPRTVEVRYQLEENLPVWGNFTMSMPYVQNMTWIRGMYWQVVLPGDTHIFAAPDELTMEYTWGWNQCFWGRVPTWEQETLERWSGALSGSPTPLKMNRYVFAGMGTHETFANGSTFFLINRTMLVLVAAIVVFGLGVLFLYFQFMLRPIPLLVVLLVLGGFAFYSPDLALLGLQAAALGVLLLLLSVLFGLQQFTQHRWSKTQKQQNDDTMVAKRSPNVLTVLTDETAKSNASGTATISE